jgi:hypothetical protein
MVAGDGSGPLAWRAWEGMERMESDAGRSPLRYHVTGGITHDLQRAGIGVRAWRGGRAAESQEVPIWHRSDTS